ncbi:subtilisin-like protease SBT3.9 [Prosopis cineraria]|uniref:subtilisin-like protease SBT3.9 n=1 Tax=Prosopis cineraria TaxID=364024 RepID=UPI00240F0510|nr:subtilisin-like protease SBT3.9 [Prosopis cineraria]
MLGHQNAQIRPSKSHRAVSRLSLGHKQKAFERVLFKNQKSSRQNEREISASSSSSSFLFLIASTAMAESTPKSVDSADSSTPAVHIVYTEKPEDEEPEAYHIRTLAAVLGSEEAAKEALLYSYKSAASGFSAKLSPEQVSQISRQPGVLQVVPSRTLQLHSGPKNLH